MNRRLVLAARPHGEPKEGDLALVETPVPEPAAGQVLLRNLLVSVDPYSRIIMGNANSDQPELAIGETITGFTVAVVERGEHPDFPVGAHVVSLSGWQEFALSDGTGLRRIDPAAAPLSASLGVLGHTGMTAWVGLTGIITARPGGTLVVTAASGSVGSVAAQIGKLRGSRVVGVARGPEKTRYLLEELGLDGAVDLLAPDFPDRLAAAVPDGIDALFDNVGGELFEALLPHLNPKAEVVVCGVMSQITRTSGFSGPNRVPEVLRAVLYKDLTVRGFSVPDHFHRFPDFLAEVAPWVASGRLRHAERFVDGLAAIPAALPSVFRGGAHGKLIARLG